MPRGTNGQSNVLSMRQYACQHENGPNRLMNRHALEADFGDFNARSGKKAKECIDS